MKRRVLALGLILLAGGALAQTAPTPRTPAETFALTQGRALLKDFYEVKLDGLWNALTPQVRAQWGTPANFRAYREMGVREYGREVQLLREHTFTEGSEAFYVRSAVFEKAPKQVWALVLGFRGLRVSTFAIVLEGEAPGERQVAVGSE